MKIEQRGPVRMSVEVVGDNVLNNDLAIVEIGEPQGVCQGFIRIGGKVRRKRIFLKADMASPPGFRSSPESYPQPLQFVWQTECLRLDGVRI